MLKCLLAHTCTTTTIFSYMVNKNLFLTKKGFSSMVEYSRSLYSTMAIQTLEVIYYLDKIKEATMTCWLECYASYPQVLGLNIVRAVSGNMKNVQP